ncbi:Nif11-like leader peptide family natural product precursor [Cyanobacterium aponinum UTEX 3222]|uniref:Bacteriocin propeptide, TIGR03798 family n=3 Tax=Cyanobacterium aponinum TaxID=379064 RepID=K9Z3M0_CYAAP|nr:Nif11-like leader peptide family natural product precursor [Cyanobacterium aponinum]RMD72979.1 MAG: Nif11-like leader peptide family natural product precursor [Cyanobacteria bacterium J149]WRL41141.1 Nif11-like leader peptide family natural product precursor [Cyanobacterium aponinum UTEX 3222]AFZ53170.1 bacteriocin propeptide, TIGR03798 family [Cyanobacterium aponinum PCC 10605]MBD2395825.1 Nif11-like leader peptide family natural product precursor [Cyanobacterium aponinum FACHB-4101]MTF407
MSQEAVVQFLDAVPENEQLQQRLVTILETSENDREDAAKLANEYGYDITPEELWAEIQKRQEEAVERQESGELTDEELEAVAGGEVVAITVAAIGAASTIFSALIPKIKW